ncbi:hypothetical protein AGABI2DRAFT_177014 [Agaricus bisporus var. bisporus H97]|uniref:hypothetical protein n=1 Tax=Agaricus bisporus var. bisporus (strain H97 / ATCC MYA-4626 / FGSC 10389) TaxID=936046 RepID=UPI00029F6A4F|nr:hypothetical protein AGABI2DRAFT_177014 [Agaricus bisporus var. bisporus H97]EKV50765.1 hypothetical protein AGABI2DRAFT_177014 [Agaricus bisporus var. bisporus H97]
MHLLDLPVEILFEILIWLDGNSLIVCRSVSKFLRAFLDDRPEFEYQYRLEKQGLVSTYGIRYPYEGRLLTLKSFSRAWRASEIPRPPTQTYLIEGDCIAYELVAGVFAKTDGLNLTIQWLPSFLRPAQKLVRSQAQLGIPIKDFALDPAQDVVALLEADNLPPVVLQGRKVNIHLRTLSTNMPHPEAQMPTISFDIPYSPRGNDLSAVTIQLGSDILSLFFSVGPGQLHLLLWDWKSGATILNSMYPTLHLPPFTRSFELLGPRSYAVLSIEGSGCIYIYNIDYPRKPIIPPFCVAKLNFPDLQRGIHLASISSHTGPFLGRPRNDSLFTTASDSRVYVISVRFLNSAYPHGTFFLLHSAFEPYLQIGGVQSEELDVPWETWSHRKFFFIPLEIPSNWLRYAHGTRVLLSTGNESRNVTILDFNVNESTHSIRDSDSNWTNIYPQLRYSSALTPTMWKLSLQTACTSFMIDEGFVLGLQTTGNFEETIRNLEVFSMYPTPNVT